MSQDVPISPLPGTSSNYGSAHASGPDLDGMGHRSIDAQFKELRYIYIYIYILLPLARVFADFDNHVKTMSEAVGAVSKRQAMPSLPRWRCLQKWNRTSAPLQKMSALSLHAYATLKQMQLPPPAAPVRQALGTYLDKVMGPQPTGPLGPTTWGLLTTTGTQDADLILFQAQRMNMHEVPFCHIFRVNSSTLHCKTGSLSARLVFETRAKCQDFVVDTKMIVSPTKLTVHFCNVSTKITVRQSKSLEDREIGRRFALLWKVLSAKLQEIFPERDVTDTFIVPALDICSQILSILDRRNGVGKPVFKLAPPRHEQLFDLTAPDLCEPSIPDDVQRQDICQASLRAQNRTATV